MTRFAKIVNSFQPSAIFIKAPFYIFGRTLNTPPEITRVIYDRLPATIPQKRCREAKKTSYADVLYGIQVTKKCNKTKAFKK